MGQSLRGTKHSIQLQWSGSGVYESLSRTRAHQRFACFVFECFSDGVGTRYCRIGSMTCRREDLERGFEPDECYWIAHESQVRGSDRIDLSCDPPPDLLLEVELTRSFLDRLAIAARLGVDEVRRYNGQTTRIMLLGSDEQYVENTRSSAFPFLPVVELARFLNECAKQSETKLLRAVRVWVREQMANGWPTTPAPASERGLGHRRHRTEKPAFSA